MPRVTPALHSPASCISMSPGPRKPSLYSSPDRNRDHEHRSLGGAENSSRIRDVTRAGERRGAGGEGKGAEEALRRWRTGHASASVQRGRIAPIARIPGTAGCVADRSRVLVTSTGDGNRESLLPESAPHTLS